MPEGLGYIPEEALPNNRIESGPKLPGVVEPKPIPAEWTREAIGEAIERFWSKRRLYEELFDLRLKAALREAELKAAERKALTQRQREAADRETLDREATNNQEFQARLRLQTTFEFLLETRPEKTHRIIGDFFTFVQDLPEE